MLVEKYKPKILKDIVGQDEAIKEFTNFLKNYKLGEVAIICGPVGSGKTSLVRAAANEMGYSLIEFSTENVKNISTIINLLSESTKLASLVNKPKLIFFDEIDNLILNDRKGLNEILKISKHSLYPIVMTVNNIYNPKLKPLVDSAKVIKFKKISVFSIEKYLKKICDIEKVKIDELIIKQISRSCNGDMRSALLELQNAIAAYSKEYSSWHDTQLNVFDTLKIVFKSNFILSSLDAINKCEIEPEKLLFWIEKNIPLEYSKPEEIASAYEKLSKADLFLSKVVKRQNWRFKEYMIEILAGINLSREKPNNKFIFYQPPDQYFKNQEKNLKEIALKLHCSSKKIKNEYLPFFKIIFKDKLEEVLF
ncbi:MAG: replication factor C large subunit [Candidatus Aenigmatarchaeota archaeon]|nr:replication factor C large subunit [Candidatus Aenigmarchaeota archaeon]